MREPIDEINIGKTLFPKAGKIIIVVNNLSHFHASLPIAEGLSRLGNQVIYFCAGFEDDSPKGFYNFAINKLTLIPDNAEELADGRNNDLSEQLYDLAPNLIILDADLEVYITFLSTFNIQTVLLNFFVPFRKERNMPPFTSIWIPRKSIVSAIYVEILWLRYFMSPSYFRRFLIFKARRKQISVYFKIPDHLKADYKRIFPGFKNIINIHTCSSEFNFKHKTVSARNLYMGHAVSSNRIEQATENEFSLKWNKILSQNHGNDDHKIIFCAFGGFSHFHLKECMRFYHLLISLFQKTPFWTLVLALGNRLDPNEFQYSENILLVKTAPQLQILEQADVMITHGGMNSINESIATGVPMLVYPLNHRGDQPGNSARIEFHKIGIRGDIRNEDEFSLLHKLMELVSDVRYKDSVRALMEDVISRNPLEQTLDYLHKVANR